MDHSTILYLMGPDGKFVKHFTYGTDVKGLAEGLREAIQVSNFNQLADDYCAQSGARFLHGSRSMVGLCDAAAHC